jgi:hypothetical protein
MKGIETDMATESREFRQLVKRCDTLRTWLKENAPDCEEKQLHLEEGSQERVYWHYGYMVALRDAVRLISGQSSFVITDHSKDNSTSIPSA